MKLALVSVLAAGALAAPVYYNNEDGIEGRFIVKFEEGGFDNLRNVVSLAETGVLKAKVSNTFNIANGKFLAISAEMSQEAVDAVSKLPGVEYVEQDGYAHAMAQQPISDTGLWGLDRIDGVFDNVYNYADSAGAGSVVYVLDTGIRITHNDFNGRATSGAECANLNSCRTGSAADTGDRNGHGTHCAGTVAGDKHGVAKAAEVVAVKVLGDNGSGSWTGVIGGVEWADQDCISRGESVCIQSMSLGGGLNNALNDAVNAVYSSRSLVIAASGNSNWDACSFSPASATYAFAVNSAQRSSNSLTRSSFSNYGRCTQLFAAGSSVLSAYHTSDSATATLSGTSMACPHIAGAAGTCVTDGARSPSQVWDCLLSGNQNGVIGGNNAEPNIFYTN